MTTDQRSDGNKPKTMADKLAAASSEYVAERLPSERPSEQLAATPSQIQSSGPSREGADGSAATPSETRAEYLQRVAREPWALPRIVLGPPISASVEAEPEHWLNGAPKLRALVTGRIFYANVGDLERETLDFAADMERRAEQAESQLERMRKALERAEGCIRGLLGRTPVRDVSETLAEIGDALKPATGEQKASVDTSGASSHGQPDAERA